MSPNVRTVLSGRSKTTCQACEKIVQAIFFFRQYIFYYFSKYNQYCIDIFQHDKPKIFKL